MGFAAAARAEGGGEGGEGLSLQVAEGPEVLDPNQLELKGLNGFLFEGHLTETKVSGQDMNYIFNFYFL